MTLFSRRRRRRYSWPYSTPNSSRIQERQNPISDRDIRALKQYFGDDGNPQRVPIIETIEKFGFMDEDEDDAVSAGIVRSKTMRHARHYRIWPSSCCDDSNDNMDDDDIVSSVTEAGEAPSAILRRIVPQVDRARLFSHSTSRTEHGRTDGDGDDVMVSYYEMNSQRQNSRSARQAAAQNRDFLMDPNLLPEESQRRHRRCHSEQPRSWREPSAELWPLKEE